MQQSPGQSADPRRKPSEHVLRQSGAEEDLAHPDEQRQGGEGPGGGRAPDGGADDRPERRCRQKDEADNADDNKRDCDPDAQRQDAEQEEREDERFQHLQSLLPIRDGGGSVTRRVQVFSDPGGMISLSLSRMKASSRKRAHSRTAPTTMAACGIQTGMPIKPAERSPKSQES